MSISLCVATWYQPEWARCVSSWNAPAYIVPRMGILDAYQKGYETIQDDIIAYIHDDLLCLELGWQTRVLAEFSDPNVAIVGFAGAPGYGHPAMYHGPYQLASLGRVGFRSNLANAEVHGARFEGSCNVGVLDGLALIVRRSFLESIGGWRWRHGDVPFDYFLYSEALCFHAIRQGWKIRMVGISCDHMSGKSTGLNPNLNPNFDGEHRRLWEDFRDVMPVRVAE